MYLHSLIVIITFFLGSSQSLANVNNTNILSNPLDASISSIPALFQALLEVLLIFAVPIVVFFIIFAGFKYVTARGNPEKIKQAHQALIWAIIGGLLILGANVLLDIVNQTICSVIGNSPTNNCQ